MPFHPGKHHPLSGILPEPPRLQAAPRFHRQHGWQLPMGAIPVSKRGNRVHGFVHSSVLFPAALHCAGSMKQEMRPALDSLGETHFPTGGDKGSRTPDLLNAIETLYQLSYIPDRVKTDDSIPNLPDGCKGHCEKTRKTTWRRQAGPVSTGRGAIRRSCP